MFFRRWLHRAILTGGCSSITRSPGGSFAIGRLIPACLCALAQFILSGTYGVLAGSWLRLNQPAFPPPLMEYERRRSPKYRVPARSATGDQWPMIWMFRPYPNAVLLTRLWGAPARLSRGTFRRPAFERQRPAGAAVRTSMDTRRSIVFWLVLSGSPALVSILAGRARVCNGVHRAQSVVVVPRFKNSGNVRTWLPHARWMGMAQPHSRVATGQTSGDQYAANGVPFRRTAAFASREPLALHRATFQRGTGE